MSKRRRRVRHKKRRDPWSLFFVWLGVVGALLMLVVLVKAVVRIRAIYHWFRGPVVNVLVVSDRQPILLSLNKVKGRIYMYRLPNSYKWQDPYRRNNRLSLDYDQIKLMENRIEQKRRWLKRLEYNLAVPVKAVVGRRSINNCPLGSSGCWFDNLLPWYDRDWVGLSWQNRWFWRLVYGGWDKEVVDLSINPDLDLNKVWDANWQRSATDETQIKSVGLFFRIKDKELISWYQRLAANMGWRLVQNRFLSADELDSYINANYCSGPVKDQKWMETWFNCLYVDKFDLPDARSDVVVIVGSKVW